MIVDGSGKIELWRMFRTFWIATRRSLPRPRPMRPGLPARCRSPRRCCCTQPSGNLFGLTQNAGMGWEPSRLLDPEFLILSTHGGMRAADGTPIALGFHTGHWEVGLLGRRSRARVPESPRRSPLRAPAPTPAMAEPRAPTGMLDSLPYRNDAAMVLRRLMRSLPTAQRRDRHRHLRQRPARNDDGPCVLRRLPSVLVPGGVTLLPTRVKMPAKSRPSALASPRARSSLEYAAEMGCRACATPGGGCQFLGTAATSQVVAEALGLSLPHSALAPSGQPIWLDAATRSARALCGWPPRVSGPATC